MNDQMRELAKRAGFVGENLDSTVFGTCQETALVNFAELIVKECASIDFRHRVGLTSDDSYDISNVIREHFGVEE